MHPNLEEYLARFAPCPEEWFTDVVSSPTSAPLVQALTCESYSELLEAWQLAMDWTDPLDISFTSMLAVVASTKLLDDQLWLRVIGKPGTAKTTLCEALASNLENVLSLSKFKGLHSGFREPGAGGEDSSLIPRMLDKTTIINEADVLLKLPNLNEVLSEIRDLYSGITRSNYRNGKHTVYEGLRTSLIIAGTPTMRALNRSAAGDRFLDSIIHDKEPSSVVTQRIDSILTDTFDSMLLESNGNTSTRIAPKLYHAYQKTAGFITYLRKQVGRGVPDVSRKTGEKGIRTLIRDCNKLGNLVAIMRYRPADPDEPGEAEFHVRLSKQLIKLSTCSAFVLGSPVDSEVMRRTAKVAKDTCYGQTYQIASILLEGSRDESGIAARLSIPSGKVKENIRILKSLDVVSSDLSVCGSGALNAKRHIFKLNYSLKELMIKLNSLLGE